MNPLTDNDMITKAQKQMQQCALSLGAMSEKVADSRQIKEYDSDRRKRALAGIMAEFLDQGESAAAADCKARASKQYSEALLELGLQYRDALRTIEKADASKILFQSAQSVLSVEKAKLGIL